MSRSPIRVLVLDGGGIRGLSSLLILREITQRMQARKGTTVHPSDCFDLIVGTGTGGVSSLLLGRMRMTVDEAIEEYVRMAKTAFKPSFLSLARTLGPKQAVLDGSALDRNIGDIAHRYLHNSDALLADPPLADPPLADPPLADPPLADPPINDDMSRCLTAVLATTRDYADAPPHIFRSYHTTRGPPSPFTIRQVARATAAAVSIFPPVKLGNVEYIDAGLAGWNNPTEITLQEVAELWSVILLNDISSCSEYVIETGKLTVASKSPFFHPLMSQSLLIFAHRIALAYLCARTTLMERALDGQCRGYGLTSKHR